jgi:outer membrane protein TolC
MLRCAIIFITVASLAPAQELTLADCVRLAEGVPSQLSLARQDRDIANREITQARASFLPSTQINSGYVYNSTVAGGTGSFVNLNGPHEYITQATIAQELDTSGRLRADLQRARAVEGAATASIGIAQRDLKRAVAAAYYRLLLTRRLVKVAGDALDESRSFERRSQLLFQNGEAARADVVKAQSQTAVLEAALKSAQTEAELANYELAAFWTRDVTAQLAIEDVFEKPPPSAEEIPATQGTPYLRRLEFNLLDAQKRTFEAESRGARSAMLPHLTFAFQYGLDAPAFRASERGYAAFVNLNIPVFDWLKASAAAREFQLRAQQVDGHRAMTERATSKEYESARTRVRRYFEQIAALEAQVKLAEEDLMLSRVRYEGGEGSALDVVTVQNQLAQARAGYYTNLANYLIARADLEVADGR